ncbi:conjugal transfer protein TrbL family protein, partial [Paenibacillus sonchi]
WVNSISSLGLVTALFGLVFVVCFFILYFQFLMRGLEMFILRVGIPLACAGLLDNDRGVFRAYTQKFMQSMLTVVIQIALAKLGVGLMLQSHVFWGLACMMLAIKTPRFLSDFLITSGGGGGGVVNNVYHSVKLVGMARKMT